MRSKILILTVFILTILPLSAQLSYELKKIKIDSLKQVLPGLEGTKRINAMNRMALGLSRNHPDSCMTIGKRTIKLSESMDYQMGIADGFFNVGLSYFFIDSIKPMVLNYLAALRIYEEIETCMQKGFVLDQLSNVNRLTGRYSRAKDYSRRAIMVYNLLSLQRYEIGARLSLAIIYIDNEQYDSAFHSLEQISDLLNKYPDDKFRNVLYSLYSSTYNSKYWDTDPKNEEYFLEAVSWALKTIELGEKLFIEKKLPAEIMVMFLYNLGTKYINHGTEEDIAKGIKYIRSARSIYDTIDQYPFHALKFARRFARLEMDRGNYQKAISLLTSGLTETENRALKVSNKDYDELFMVYTNKYYTHLYKMRVYDLLFQLYKKLGNHETALEYYILKVEAEEKIFNEDNRNMIVLLEAESENERAENKITLLKRDNELKDVKVNQSRMLNAGVGILFVILILVGFLYIRQNKLKNEHKSILLEQKLLRLQMNPHFIFNAFSNILRFIDNNETSKASNYLTTFSKLLRTTLESTRADMVPFEKEVGNLRNYLELQKLRYPEKFVYSLKVDENISEDEMSIPPMLVQPFIENAIEHGIRHKEEKGRIDVRFVLQGKKIICEVEDDGVGREKVWEAEYEERGDKKSMATEIILERIKLLNKKFRQKIDLKIIDKEPATYGAPGTKVVIDLPWGDTY